MEIDLLVTCDLDDETKTECIELVICLYEEFKIAQVGSQQELTHSICLLQNFITTK